ncbi:hypothetical protein [Magnetospirillum sulfuroxidans]|uniref:Uncharacterized protein n=1 Tax=Magnetospirillum sulfuroxidans TaxID=611300 RepID=A0ABS5IAK4_9PROT|nr:hypothetical protein [Magnetospirillum sulfuroxidans]MBR9971450.1 hypothetical protein [Magnetospirillum sulfuroxidans]
MSKTILTVGDFSDLLDRLGPELGRWPSAERQGAEALLLQSDEAAALLTDALVLADTISAVQPKAPAGLADRIIAAAGAEKPKT